MANAVEFPSIKTLDVLANLLGVNIDFLVSVYHNREIYYREFNIPKRKGGFRSIQAPMPSLKFAQHQLYKSVLSVLNAHPSSHAFVQGRSIITNASSHLNGREFLHLDLKNFFPSITDDRIARIFESLGFESPVSDVMTALCSFGGSLPQGAPSSPAVSNICAFCLDLKLSKLASDFDITYTRYSDDLTFSGHRVPSHFLRFAAKLVEEEGFVVNDD